MRDERGQIFIYTIYFIATAIIFATMTFISVGFFEGLNKPDTCLKCKTVRGM
jgi:hypothetical protein